MLNIVSEEGEKGIRLQETELNRIQKVRSNVTKVCSDADRDKNKVTYFDVLIKSIHYN